MVVQLIELPLDLKSQVFCSPMPFSEYDTGRDIWNLYQQSGVEIVVMLSSDEECFENTGLDLRSFYVESGLRVIYFPIPDFGIPSLAALEDIVSKALKIIRKGKTLAIHCSAGKGRTGMFATCLVMQVLELSGERALKLVRLLIQGAVETKEQEQLLVEFGSKEFI